MSQPNFYNLTLPELEAHFVSLGEKKFRGSQLYRWVYGRKVNDFAQMTDMSKALREALPGYFDWTEPKMVSDLLSVDGTRKFLFQIEDNMTFEAVLIPSKDRLTLCVSSEVGCNMACQFCFTGKQKLKRRLTVGEIVTQVLQVTRKLPEETRISNIVFMGMGEPLDNIDAVFPAIEVMHSTWGFNIAKKKITVSTSGIVPMIQKVTDSGARLAVSLNATTDEVRNKIMPINKKWPLDVLLEACHSYCDQTGDRVTLEYVLLKDVTDSLEDAERLAKIAKSLPCKINIIPFNEHPGSGFHRPSKTRVEAFQKRLMQLGVHVLLRKTMGRDIYAACGQLTSAFEDHPKTLEEAMPSLPELGVGASLSGSQDLRP